MSAERIKHRSLLLFIIKISPSFLLFWHCMLFFVIDFFKVQPAKSTILYTSKPFLSIQIEFFFALIFIFTVYIFLGTYHSPFL